MALYRARVETASNSQVPDNTPILFRARPFLKANSMCHDDNCDVIDAATAVDDNDIKHCSNTLPFLPTDTM